MRGEPKKVYIPVSWGFRFVCCAKLAEWVRGHRPIPQTQSSGISLSVERESKTVPRCSPFGTKNEK